MPSGISIGTSGHLAGNPRGRSLPHLRGCRLWPPNLGNEAVINRVAQAADAS